MNERFALLPAQESIWFAQRASPRGGRFNRSSAHLAPPSLSVEEIRTAGDTLAQLFPSLACSYSPSEPSQAFHDGPTLTIGFTDAAAWSEEGLQTALRRLARRPFDLTRGPLLRAHLFARGSDKDGVLFVGAHEIAVSQFVLHRIAFLLSNPAMIVGQHGETLPTSTREAYAAYVSDICRRGRGNVDAIRHWRTALSGEPAFHPFETSSVPGTASSEGEETSFKLSERLQHTLQNLCNMAGTNTEIALLSCLAIVLARYTSRNRVVMGRATFEPKESFAALVPTTSPLCVAVEDAADFYQVTRSIRESLLSNRDYAPFYPSDLDRGCDHGIPYGVCLSYVPRSLQASKHLGSELIAKINTEELIAGSVSVGGVFYKDTIEISIVEAGPNGSDLWCTGTSPQRGSVRRLLRQLETVAVELLENPDRSVWKTPLLDAHEAKRLLVEWNDTAEERTGPPCLHEWLSERAAQTPTAAVVEYDDESLSYAELEARSNNLAVRLISEGVRPDDLVAVCADPSVEMLVGIFGTLKSGAAFVPVDPAHPGERIRTILDDSRPAAFLSTGSLIHLAAGTGTKTLPLDRGDAVDASPRPPPSINCNENNLAYVIYTSGSTGRPKGVMIPHRAVVNHLSWLLGAIPLGRSDCGLLKSTFTFDISIAEIFPSVLSGARLVIAPEGGRRDSRSIAELMRDRGVSYIQAVPYFLQELLDEPALRDCRELRYVSCGGDVVTQALSRKFAETIPWAQLYVGYGPTETTVEVLHGKCLASPTPQTPPLGVPIANVRTYVLDRNRQPVPVGVAGELYVGGKCLARGYLNQPELTDTCFVPSPFPNQEGERLYKTGDLVRWRAEGELEFVGRVDRQVKVRGYRIETREVERCIELLRGVEQAVVVSKLDPATDTQQLVAYVQTDPDGSVTEAGVREHLSGRLPDYMIPSSIELVERFPATFTGKVDIAQLTNESPLTG